MSHRPLPPRLSTALGIPLLALALALFTLLAADLVNHGTFTQGDVVISKWFHSNTRPVLTQVLLAVTHMHSTLGISLMALAAAAFLIRRRQWQWLPLLALGVGGGSALNALVKLAFHRGRPVFDDPFLTLATSSFPSGHTAGATVWWGFFVTLVFAHRPEPRWRIAATVLAVALVSLTALSRVYLGVHYPSDVMAAIAEGVAWLSLCFMASGLVRRAGLGASGIGQHG